LRFETGNKLWTSLAGLLRQAKQWGYSNVQLRKVFAVEDAHVAGACRFLGLEPVYKLVDTCAAEFEAYTPYYYSAHEQPATIPNAFAEAIDRFPDLSPECAAPHKCEHRDWMMKSGK
jgi:hypothetical protein